MMFVQLHGARLHLPIIRMDSVLRAELCCLWQEGFPHPGHRHDVQGQEARTAVRFRYFCRLPETPTGC